MAGKAKDLIYAGEVDHGFDKELVATLRQRAHDPVDQGIWVEPELVAEIEYRAKSAEGKDPFFKGLREDL